MSSSASLTDVGERHPDSAATAATRGGPAGVGDPCEDEPPAAAQVFGPQLAAARRYVELLVTAGIERGLIGPREIGRIWTRHVLNCAVVTELVTDDERVVDIGSGAGLPGICLALAQPAVQVDLVEPLLRRATFLTEVVEELGLTNCRVIRARAEEAVDAVGGSDMVTARAVAPLARLSRWAAPLLRDGGNLIAIKGASAAAEVERDRAAARRAGMDQLQVVTVGAGVLDQPTTVVIGRRRIR